MHRIFAISLLLLPSTVFAATGASIPFSFKNRPITEVIEGYAKATGRHFLVDSRVVGKVNIINPKPITEEEAYNFLSLALAGEGYAIMIHPSTGPDKTIYQVIPTRDAQRSGLEVVTELPSAEPQRMVTYVRALKFAKAEDVIKEMRILNSKDGEMVVSNRENKLIFTDWISNLYRIEKILAELDRMQTK